MPTHRWEKWVQDSNGGTIRYRAYWGTEFEVDGDLTKNLEIRYYGSYENNKEYILRWMRDKLRKLENGQIKAVKSRERGDWTERDWEQEEELKEKLWKDIANGVPLREEWVEYACGPGLQTMEAPRRSPSPTCKIS